MTTTNQSDRKSAFFAESGGVLFMALVVAAANGLHLFFILFPELAAISNDVLTRPAGKWAKEPWKLVATPVATGCIGVLVGRLMPYGVAAILLTMVASIGVIVLLRSAVSPAISAGVLPIVLGVTSWLYPLCILASLGSLTLILLIWRMTPAGRALSPAESRDAHVVEILESAPQGSGWFPSLLLFVAIVGAVAQITAWRFILFPPLIVMAYEMLGHPKTCPWAKPPYTFPLACFAAAAVGVASDRYLGVTPVAAGIVLAFTIVLLRLLRLRLPPALAIGLIPFVIPSPAFDYAYSVGVGTIALTVWFLAHRRITAGSRLAAV